MVFTDYSLEIHLLYYFFPLLLYASPTTLVGDLPVKKIYRAHLLQCCFFFGFRKKYMKLWFFTDSFGKIFYFILFSFPLFFMSPPPHFWRLCILFSEKRANRLEPEKVSRKYILIYYTLFSKGEK